MVGNGKGAKNGILFKTAASLEETGRIQIVALDKTGTIHSRQAEGYRYSAARLYRGGAYDGCLLARVKQ